MTTEQMTPTRAIRQAIQTLDYERTKLLRQENYKNDDAARANINAEFDEEVAALEQAIEQLKQFAALKAMLKAVVQE